MKSFHSSLILGTKIVIYVCWSPWQQVELSIINIWKDDPNIIVSFVFWYKKCAAIDYWPITLRPWNVYLLKLNMYSMLWCNRIIFPFVIKEAGNAHPIRSTFLLFPCFQERFVHFISVFGYKILSVIWIIHQHKLPFIWSTCTFNFFIQCLLSFKNAFLDGSL